MSLTVKVAPDAKGALYITLKSPNGSTRRVLHMSRNRGTYKFRTRVPRAGRYTLKAVGR